MIDSHTHLFLCEGSEAELVSAATAAGVGRMLTVGLDEATNAEAIASSERHDGVFAAVGRHPNEADGFDDAAAAEIARLAAHEQVRAIGETGLDYYRDSATAAAQRRAFAAQIEIAAEAGLPIVIHCREPEGSSEAIDEVIATLDAKGAGLTVVLHCFCAPRGWPRRSSAAGTARSPATSPIRNSGGLREAAADDPRGQAPGRDRCALPLAAAGARQAERARQRRRYRRGDRGGPRGSPTRSWSATVEANARALFGW